LIFKWPIGSFNVIFSQRRQIKTAEKKWKWFWACEHECHNLLPTANDHAMHALNWLPENDKEDTIVGVSMQENFPIGRHLADFFFFPFSFCETKFGT